MGRGDGGCWARAGARAMKCWVTGARALTCCRRRGGWSSRLPVPWEPAVFLFVLLQDEGTPNGRLRERAGRLDVVYVVWEEPDGAPWGIAAAGGNCVGAAA